jgi:hypothetical protein
MKVLYIPNIHSGAPKRSSKKGKGGRSTATVKERRHSRGSLPQIGSMQDTGSTPIASDDVGGVETKAEK